VTAKRFGGTFSPGGQGRPAVVKPPPRTKWSRMQIRPRSLRATGLFLFPTPLLFGALGAIWRGDAPGFVWMAATYAALILGAGLTRVGIAAQAEYEARAVAKPPAFPRKLFGAALTGLGVGVASFFAAFDPVRALIFGAAAAVLHVVAFGPDPMRAKGLNGLDQDAIDEAITRVETARAVVADMTRAAAAFGDRTLEERVAALAASAEQTLAMIERDPRDLRRARRFRAVYLVGARDATVRFAQAWTHARDPDARAEYEALLTDLETHFAAHRDTLALDDRTALDVEIEVLRDRLRLEGV
jgi:hypothetical protein